MTVEELMRHLAGFPPNAIVWGTYEGTGRRLRTEDIDMHEERLWIDVDLFSGPATLTRDAEDK